MIFSYSRLSLYERCPAAFSYKYLVELPEPPSEALVRGKAVHTAIQSYLLGDDIGTAAKAAIETADLPVDTEEVIKLASHPTVMNIMGGQVEQHFSLPMDSAKNIIIQGYIDWWNTAEDTAQLIDWKTNRNPYAPANNHQMGLYSWALSQLHGCSQVEAELVFLRFAGNPWRYLHTYKDNDMEEARQWALGLAVEIEQKLAEWSLVGDSQDDNLFPATPGKQCQYCGYASLCIRSAKIETLAIEDSADARKVAAEVIRLEAALDDMKGKLKAWVKENGAITIGDSAFDFVPSISWAIGAEKLYELCSELHENGIDVFQYLTLTAANLKKIGVTDETLAAYGKQKTTKTFRLVKIKEAC